MKKNHIILTADPADTDDGTVTIKGMDTWAKGAVDVRAEAGRILIEPVVVAECDLAELVLGITPDNMHHEVDCGEAVGKELLS